MAAPRPDTAIDAELAHLDATSRTRALTAAESTRLAQLVSAVRQREYRAHARQRQQRRAA